MCIGLCSYFDETIRLVRLKIIWRHRSVRSYILELRVQGLGSSGLAVRGLGLTVWGLCWLPTTMLNPTY